MRPWRRPSPTVRTPRSARHERGTTTGSPCDTGAERGPSGPARRAESGAGMSEAQTETVTATGEIRLEIPAAPEYLRLARLAVADVGARAGWSYEDIDDLRIAVDELCYAIGAGAEHGRLTLTYRVA